MTRQALVDVSLDLNFKDKLLEEAYVRAYTMIQVREQLYIGRSKFYYCLMASHRLKAI